MRVLLCTARLKLARITFSGLEVWVQLCFSLLWSTQSST